MSMKFQVWLLGPVIAATTAVAANGSTSVRVSPVVSFAPSNLTVSAQVEPDANNRAMEVVVDSEEFYRSSTIPLDGDHAPKTITFQFRSLPSGEYKVTASVAGANGQWKVVGRAHVNIIGPQGSQGLNGMH